jgi:iron complex outermembrane recepter protein
VVDYEIGWKSRFLNNHIRTQIGGYYNDFSHFQVSVPLPNNPQFSTEVNNPHSTTLYGFEAQVQAAYGGFSLNSGLGLEHSALGAFYVQDARVGVTTGVTCDPSTGPTSATCINLKGHQQTYAPDLTFNVGAQYDFKLGDGDVLTPAINYSHVSSQWGLIFQNRAEGDHLGPRNVLGASLAWTHAGYTVTAYGYNLTDDQYISALLPPIRLAGAPRQFGISVLKPF